MLKFETSNSISELPFTLICKGIYTSSDRSSETVLLIVCEVREIEYGRGSGRSMTDAERIAAKQAVMQLCELEYDAVLSF